MYKKKWMQTQRLARKHLFKAQKKTICNLGTVGAMHELGDWVLLKAPPFRAPTRPELIKKMAQSIDKLDKKLELEFLPSI